MAVRTLLLLGPVVVIHLEDVGSAIFHPVRHYCAVVPRGFAVPEASDLHQRAHRRVTARDSIWGGLTERESDTCMAAEQRGGVAEPAEDSLHKFTFLPTKSLHLIRRQLSSELEPTSMCDGTFGRSCFWCKWYGDAVFELLT